jgi:hypothetical protein
MTGKKLIKGQIDEKVLLLPVVYEKYNYLLLSMNFNAEFYKFYFTKKNFSKFALLLTFFHSQNYQHLQI